MGTTTTNYSLYKPDDGESGVASQLNANLDTIDTQLAALSASSGGITDGDKGDITVSGGGATWTIDAGVVTPAKLSFDPATQSELDAHTGNTSNPHSTTASQVGAEPALGNPASDGYVLSSTTTGTRSWVAQSGGGGGVTDGDKGDITVSSSGATWTIDTGAVSTSKLGGDITTAGKALLDDADAAAQRTTLGLGTMATQAASSVAVTGGSIAGITDLAVADGGTGASTAAAARTNLGTVGYVEQTAQPTGGPWLWYDTDDNTTSNPLMSATGDAQNMYSITTTGQVAHFSRGTAASPDTNLNPLLKVERLLGSIAEGSVNGDGGEQLAGIQSVVVGGTGTQVQPVGIYGAAKTSSTSGGTEPTGHDACGVYGAGRVTGSGSGVAIGGFFIGRRDNDTGFTTGIEVHAANYGTANTTYSSTGYSSTAIWMNASGNADTAAALIVGNAFGRQFTNGIVFNAQVNNSKTGGVSTNSIRDDSSSTTSIAVNGTHSYGIDFNGATSITTAIRLKNNSPISARNAAGTADMNILYLSNANGCVLGEGASSIYFPKVIGLADAVHIHFGTGTGTKLGATTTQKLGFWNATPIVQPTGIADADGSLADITTKFNSLLAKLESMGLLAVA